MKYRILLSVALVAITALGCGSSTKHPVVPVQGTLAFADGTKLPAGTQLLFNPSEGGVGTALGTTTEDGSFEVTHAMGGDGAEEAKYTVQLRAPEGQDAEFYSRVPRIYCDPGVLMADVRSGMAPLNFVVKKVR